MRRRRSRFLTADFFRHHRPASLQVPPTPKPRLALATTVADTRMGNFARDVRTDFSYTTMKQQHPISISIVLFSLWILSLLLLPQARAEKQAQPTWQLEHDFYNLLWKGELSNAFVLIKGNPEIVNKPLWTGEAPITVAAGQGHSDFVELLLTNKADINGRGHFGRTALHYAVHNGAAKTVSVLLKYKADPNAQDSNHCTPIICPIGDVEILKLLLAHGANINAHEGVNTVLAQTINDRRAENLQATQFLLTNGVDVALSGNEGLV
jgi:hypothetical protein